MIEDIDGQMIKKVFGLLAGFYVLLVEDPKTKQRKNILAPKKGEVWQN